jgi:hypothetical protein
VTDHAITIRGRPQGVWPWLVQMGWHRGGWDTYRWVDRLLFPANAPSAEEIRPELQGLREGDEIPDGPPESRCTFRVEAIEPGRLLVLRSRSHLPPFPRDRWLDRVWTYSLRDAGPGRVRLHLRTRAALGPGWLAAAYAASLWMDLVMARSHLMGIRERVERGVSEPCGARDDRVAALPTAATGGPSSPRWTSRSWEGGSRD